MARLGALQRLRCLRLRRGPWLQRLVDRLAALLPLFRLRRRMLSGPRGERTLRIQLTPRALVLVRAALAALATRVALAALATLLAGLVLLLALLADLALAALTAALSLLVLVLHSDR